MDYRIINMRTVGHAYDCTKRCTVTVRESALKVKFERTFSCRLGEPNLRHQSAGPTLYQMSSIPAPKKLGRGNSLQQAKHVNLYSDLLGPVVKEGTIDSCWVLSGRGISFLSAVCPTSETFDYKKSLTVHNSSCLLTYKSVDISLTRLCHTGYSLCLRPSQNVLSMLRILWRKVSE